MPEGSSQRIFSFTIWYPLAYLTLQAKGTQLLFTRWSPVNRVDLYRHGGQRKPFWVMRGLPKGYRSAAA
jgi:hypothetical protein